MTYEFNPGPLPLHLPVNSTWPLCPFFSFDCNILGCTRCPLVWEPLQYRYDGGLWGLRLAAGVGVQLQSDSLVILKALKCSMGQMPCVHGNHSGCCQTPPTLGGLLRSPGQVACGQRRPSPGTLSTQTSCCTPMPRASHPWAFAHTWAFQKSFSSSVLIVIAYLGCKAQLKPLSPAEFYLTNASHKDLPPLNF